MTGRPVKRYRWKWNGTVLQLFEEGVFIGSIGEKRLVALIKWRRKDNNG